MIKAVGPMAGGSRVRSLCGALQAGVLTLGMLYGTEGEDLSSQDALVESFQPVKQFYKDFEKAFGSRGFARKLSVPTWKSPRRERRGSIGVESTNAPFCVARL